MTATAKLAEILAKRPAGVSLARLARFAEIHPSELSRLANGKRTASPGTLNRLKIAIQRLKAGATKGSQSDFVNFRMLLTRASLALSLDPVKVRAANSFKMDRSDFARKAAKARWLAFYLMNVAFEVRAVQVAWAAGVSKNAVSLALREIELMRETDPAFDGLVAALETELVGDI